MAFLPFSPEITAAEAPERAKSFAQARIASDAVLAHVGRGLRAALLAITG
jgi:hypothetical protein